MPGPRPKKALNKTQQRKKEHLELCLDTQQVTGPAGTGFGYYHFVHNALPELDFDELDVSTTFLGKRLRAPLLISSMTGGFQLARKVNRNLAAAAQQLGLAMGVGSQRVAIEEPSVADSFQVRDVAPDILLLGNLGAVQLNYGYGIDQCRRAVDMIGADGLIFHLNVLQEAVQPEGNRNFKALTGKIAAVCRALEVPVVAIFIKKFVRDLKEDPWAMMRMAARKMPNTVKSCMAGGHILVLGNGVPEGESPVGTFVGAGIGAAAPGNWAPCHSCSSSSCRCWPPCW